MTQFEPTIRSRARRRPQRASYDKAAIYSALDAGLLAHVAWVLDGQPYATPTAYWRKGNAILWHGSAASRMLQAISGGGSACVTVSRLDGLVVGRSGFAHSLNYTSVMVFGRPHALDEVSLKRSSMNAFIDRIYPGRSQTLRPITDAELAQITIVQMEIEEASLKVREGPPVALEADEGWPVWAGTIPLRTLAGSGQVEFGGGEAAVASAPAPFADGNGREFGQLLSAAAARAEGSAA